MTFEEFRKLSPAQQVFMDACALYGSSEPPWGNRAAGRAASAWHRTAHSLKNRGLVTIVQHDGGGYTARLAPGVTKQWQTPIDADLSPMKRPVYQYVCPRCDDPHHIRIDGPRERNARCTMCGWTGDSSTAADEAEERNGRP